MTMAAFLRFGGNCPQSVSKDAKYSVRTGKDGPVVALTYSTADGEYWYATTEEHAELVRMVNDVKTSLGLPPNGSFYINEYKQVIVPSAASKDYLLAGEYADALRFEFEGTVLTGEPVDLDGNALTPGDVWMGPHPGIPYVLAAGGGDIHYFSQPRPNVKKKLKLSTSVGSETAKNLVERIRSVKGYAGGSFYVNEHHTIFAPVHTGGEWQYVYIGQLDLDSWFPKPHATVE